MGKEQKQRLVRMTAILVTLFATSSLSARGATQLLASAVLPLASESTPATPRLRAAPESDRRETTRQIAEAVLRRNIFDSQTGSMDWNAPLPTDPTPTSEEQLAGEESLPDDDTELAACSSPIRLVASMVVPTKPDLSFATIQADGKTLLYRPGMQVSGHEVLGIREHRVFLRPASSPVCQVAMFTPPPANAPAPPAAPPPTPAPASEKKSAGVGEDELNQGITQVSDTKYTVSRSLLDKVLSNQAELMRAARIIPYEENGRTVGVKVYGIRRSSLLGKLGVQNGDVLRTVNGLDLSSPDSALEAYTKLRETDNFSIAMIRRGQPRTMEYTVQ